MLDLLERPGVPLTGAYKGQLERAALSVSNNIAEGFERATSGELASFLAIAKGSAGEVRSMMALVRGRPLLKGFGKDLAEIRELAESCTRQLMGWIGSIEAGQVKGKRHLSSGQAAARKAEEAARAFRQQFLRQLKPEHPLYKTDEARRARGEKVLEEQE